jgi:molybdopterin molybdotransferase
MELLNTFTVKEVQEKITKAFQDFPLKTERIPLTEAGNRVLAQDVISYENIPEFHRSTVDGYGVYYQDTLGASEGLATYLKKKFTVEMGKEAPGKIEPGECAYVPTGGMIPEGVNAVVMIEHTEDFDDNTIGIQQSVSDLENILQKGEDIQAGAVVFTKGDRLRTEDIGLLAGLGVTEVRVYQKISVGLISTGDEIVEIHQQPKLGEIRDMNRYSLGAALERDGFKVVKTAVVKDHRESLEKTLEEFLQTCDMVLISGGSSMGEKDYTKEVINALGDPGVFVHGVSMKPGKPTIIGKVGKKAVFGLPGQPVSALMVYEVLVKHLIKLYEKPKMEEPYVIGEMDRNFPSAAGRAHYFMVSIQVRNGKNYVTPVYGKSGTLSMMSRAMGYAVIGHNEEGLNKGDSLRVYPLT